MIVLAEIDRFISGVVIRDDGDNIALLAGGCEGVTLLLPKCKISPNSPVSPENLRTGAIALLKIHGDSIYVV